MFDMARKMFLFIWDVYREKIGPENMPDETTKEDMLDQALAASDNIAFEFNLMETFHAAAKDHPVMKEERELYMSKCQPRYTGGGSVKSEESPKKKGGAQARQEKRRAEAQR